MGLHEAAERYRQRIFQEYQSSIARELTLTSPADPVAAFGPIYRAHFLPHIPASKDACILDVGCGTGSLLAWLQQEGYRHVQGVDRSPQMVRLARERQVQVEQADALEYLRAHPASFDVLLCMDVLEHFFKDEAVEFLDACHAALKPGGVFVAHTLNADGIAGGRLRHIDFTHENAFTRYSLAQILTVTGFEDFIFRPAGPVAQDFRSWVRCQLWRVFRLGACLYYHAETGSGILHNDHIVTGTLVVKAVKKK